MSGESSQKSWFWDWSAYQLASFIITVAGFVGASYLGYLNYAKDIDQERAKIKAEYATRVAELVKTKDKDIAERDEIIEKQKEELNKQKRAQPSGPRPSSPGIDIEKLLRPHVPLFPPEPKSWTEQVTGFISEYWKFALLLVVILFASAITKKK